MNSYLGIVKHANSFNLRKAMLSKLDKRFFDFYITFKLFVFPLKDNYLLGDLFLMRGASKLAFWDILLKD